MHRKVQCILANILICVYANRVMKMGESIDMLNPALWYTDTRHETFICAEHVVCDDVCVHLWFVCVRARTCMCVLRACAKGHVHACTHARASSPGMMSERTCICCSCSWIAWRTVSWVSYLGYAGRGWGVNDVAHIYGAHHNIYDVSMTQRSYMICLNVAHTMMCPIYTCMRSYDVPHICVYDVSMTQRAHMICLNVAHTLMS